MTVGVDVITDFPWDREIEEFWRRNVNHMSGDLFSIYNYDWIYLWMKHIYMNEFRSRCTIMLLKASCDGRLVGIWPLMLAKDKRRSILPYRRLFFLGHGMVDYADIITCDDLDAERIYEVVEALIEYLNGNAYLWDEARLQLFPESSLHFPIIRELAHRGKLARFQSDPTENYYIRTKENTWETFIHTKSRDIKEDTRRRINKLKKRGKLDFLKNTEVEYEKFSGSIEKLHVKRQHLLGRSSLYESGPHREFALDMRNLFQTRGILDYSVLELDQKVIAYMYGFRVGTTRYSWNVSFDIEYAECSPGKVLLYFWIKDAFDEEEIEEFNFMRGGAEFKTKWTDKKRISQKVRFLSPNIYSSALAFAERWMR